MCMVTNDGGHVAMVSRILRKARKPHKCQECHRVIEPGETYEVDAYVFEGDFTAHKTCSHCHVARNWLQSECGGWLYGGVFEDLEEHVRDGNYGMPLARICVSMRCKWRRRDGSLRPVPVRPLTSQGN